MGEIHEIIDLLLEKGLSFNIRGSNAEEYIEIIYQIKKTEEKIPYTIKEHYILNQSSLFDFLDFTSESPIEILKLTLSEIEEKIERITNAMIFDIKE